MPILSTLLRELPWSAHLHVLSRSKLAEEREFYLRMAKQEQWPVREVARQIDTQLFARTVLQPPKLSAALRQSQPAAGQVLRDQYFLEFLDLQQDHTELDLHRSLLKHLGRFLTEPLTSQLERPHCFSAMASAARSPKLKSNHSHAL